MHVYDAVTTKARPLRPGWRLRDRRRRRAHPERRLRQLFKGASARRRRACWKPRSSPPMAPARTVNACTDPDLFWALKGGGGGSLRRRHPPHAADARAARHSSAACSRDDQGRIGRGVPAADRPLCRFLCRQPVQSALGRAALAFGRDNIARRRDGVPGVERAGGAGDLAARSWTGCRRHPAEDRCHLRAAHRGIPARHFWDPECARQSPAWSSPMIARALPTTTSSGPPSRAPRRAHCCTATSPFGYRASLFAGGAAEGLADALFAASRALGRVAAFQ